MRWLVRLVTPPKGVVLDPFAGSGSTGIAAAFEGHDSVLVEPKDLYVKYIKERINLLTSGNKESTEKEQEK